MARLTILVVVLFVVLLQLNEQQAADIHQISSDEIEDSLLPETLSSSLLHQWYKRFNDMEDHEQQDDLEHIWKRFSSDNAKLRQRRRFGNTRYGRSLSNNFK